MTKSRELYREPLSDGALTMLEFTPEFTVEEAIRLTQQHFALAVVDCRPLPSERDQNFVVHSSDDRRFVLKISNARETRILLDAQNRMMDHLAAHPAACPRVIPSAAGEVIVQVESTGGSRHFARLVSFLEGRALAGISYRSPELLFSLGQTIGETTSALSGFDDESLHRSFHWDLAGGKEVIAEKIELVQDHEAREGIEEFARQFERHAADVISRLPQSVIHGDGNDGNIIVAPPVRPGEPASIVRGVIDFGDAVYSWTIGELAIAMAYAILDQPDPIAAACRVVEGYVSRREISEDELAVLYGLVCRRLCMSAVIAAEQSRGRPDDQYLTVSQGPIQRTLPRLRDVPYQVATTLFRLAAGQPVSPQRESVRRWLSDHQGSYEFPLGIDAAQSSFVVIDLSVTSPLLEGDVAAINESAVTRAVRQITSSPRAAVGVGRYLEPRLLYQSDQFGPSNSERRTIHLGIDLFAPAGTEVRAVFDGVVRLVRTIDLPLDYGTLVILEHRTDDGLPFYTLYGHLARRATDLISEGQAVPAGQVIAWLGDVAENGGWTPHLHFQVMLDRLDFEDDFPGVCRASQQAAWSELCPDPNLILSLPPECFSHPSPTKRDTLAVRSRVLGSALSVGYRDPVKVVRGWMHYLYDESGRRYLDGYNNVPHVGHAHPRIVAALARQARLLNTNTRYLSDLTNAYAERVAATMPSPLGVCYFLNSASEANELALRLARAATGARDLVVLQGAYHGHTTSLIDISPYKHDGPGGEGAPDWVHVAPIADTYRGSFRDPESAGRQYAAHVRSIIQRMQSDGRRLSGFIAESCPSVGGQIIFPTGYLAEVYRAVRAAGGVCIADEVQTGYGRLGQWFYGFEMQDVVPDIVVLGKPIGNGHPIAAVVTTAEIAAAFDNGMEFFSTFGGNTVSAAVGIAVLDVLDDEHLPQQASAVGQELTSLLRGLQERHEIVGDVRGSGLFLGVEMVRNRETLEPAAAEATFVSNRMRDRGILIGTDGPLHNVLKIRPPMTFTRLDAAFLAQQLDECLGELEA